MAFEAYHTARNRRHGVPTEDFSSPFDMRRGEDALSSGRFPAGAILLIALGFLLLLDTTGLISVDELGRYWPIGLIVWGIYMLYMRLGDRNAPPARNPDNQPENPGIQQ